MTSRSVRLPISSNLGASERSGATFLGGLVPLLISHANSMWSHPEASNYFPQPAQGTLLLLFLVSSEYGPWARQTCRVRYHKSLCWCLASLLSALSLPTANIAALKKKPTLLYVKLLPSAICGQIEIWLWSLRQSFSLVWTKLMTQKMCWIITVHVRYRLSVSIMFWAVRVWREHAWCSCEYSLAQPKMGGEKDITGTYGCLTMITVFYTCCWRLPNSARWCFQIAIKPKQ